MTRTASHNSALSLGSCISAALTVLSTRTVAPLFSFSFGAGQQHPINSLPGLRADSR
jgi:hypothetical protein